MYKFISLSCESLSSYLCFCRLSLGLMHLSAHHSIGSLSLCSDSPCPQFGETLLFWGIRLCCDSLCFPLP